MMHLWDTCSRLLLDDVQSKKLDKECIEKYQIPSVVLMERAALAVCESVFEMKPWNVVVVCSYGNNGADGLAVARILHEKGIYVKVFTIGDPVKKTEEFSLQESILIKTGVEPEPLPSKKGYFQNCIRHCSVIVDGIFGIGLSRDIAEEYREVIEMMNEADAKIVAIDIPSGLHAKTGKICGACVQADQTVTFGNWKLGQYLGQGKNVCGTVTVADIGYVHEVYQCFAESKSEIACMIDNNIMKELPKRKPVSNKGTYGRLCVVAGVGNMPGACMLATEAAYRMGCGIVKVISVPEVIDKVHLGIPEAVCITLVDETTIDLQSLTDDCDALLIGPGLGNGSLARELVRQATELSIPCLFDADAINILAVHPEWLKTKGQRVFTPHVKEMARLTGKSVEEIMEDGIRVSDTFAREYQCVNVLKNAATIVSNGLEDDYTWIQGLHGNSGMATAGSGDVLAGMISGLLAQGVSTCNASKLGVYLHGCAGDLAAEEKTEYSMLASDIVSSIGKAIEREIMEV